MTKTRGDDDNNDDGDCDGDDDDSDDDDSDDGDRPATKAPGWLVRVMCTK